MIKYFCDKCGKELPLFNNEFTSDMFKVEIEPPDIRRWADNAESGTYILCYECVKKFNKWLHEPDSKYIAMKFDKPINVSRIDKIKNVIRNNYDDARCGLFFIPNWVGDPMLTIWEEDGVTIDICYYYEYFEVFGLTEEEQYELVAFYNSLGGK